MTLSDSQNMNFAVPVNSIKKLFPTARYIPVPTVSSADSETMEFEINDGMSSGNIIQMDSMVEGSLGIAGDVDYFRFDLAADGQVTFSGLAYISLTGAGVEKGFDMKLLDSKGEMSPQAARNRWRGKIIRIYPPG